MKFAIFHVVLNSDDNQASPFFDEKALNCKRIMIHCTEILVLCEQTYT